ncbi:hypothetical protein I3843_02G113300 [Carya illinoinensis]|uniref:Uncharacterized protein n=1 Tax=Carya illinoinensis TaxID=32201 RepID=A0A8T1REF7_CARIL|nr:uncharacterized protein LOC122295194 [Carya illinoinensis]KAG6664974.1 hypothetical protein CIPAW_02G130600 [Carya illinoinensis]KAG6727426.1 hypothetical protein I3842_02G128100 [Carya illinoinensis]KAG7992143.1 hypothetical protein I3843_02G113300 [Carya illinoinensis]
MKKSPVYPKHETSAFGADEIFDPNVDFSQFLEEARHHGRVVDFQSSPLYPEEKGKKRLAGDKQASKKSWKNHLFSWWKTEKKSEPRVKSTSSSYMNSLPKRHLVSGPIHGSGKTKNNDGRHGRPSSGPLTGLFNPTKRVENEIPYMCLDEVDRPQALQTYGPVYLVT